MTQQEYTSRHLTEDELEEALLGLHSAESDEHLASCALCRNKIEEFRGSLELFNQASMAWSEAKSNSLNRDLAEHKIPFRMSMRAVWTCAWVFVVLLAGIVGLDERHHQAAEADSAQRAAATSPQSSPGSSTALGEIASDNAMMQQIDAAINTPEPSPAELYGRSTTPANERFVHAAPVRN